MKQEHIDFLEKNKINFDTVKLGFTKNIPIETLQMYEHIYHQYINPNYVLTYWCGDCVFDMLKRLMNYYESNVATAADIQDIQDVEETVVQQPKAKRTRKK